MSQEPRPSIVLPIFGILIGACWLAGWSPVFMATNPTGGADQANGWPWNNWPWLLFCYGFPLLLVIVSILAILRSTKKKMTLQSFP